MFDLVRPFAYLTVRHPTRIPILVNWILPGVVALCFAILTYALVPALNVFGPQGLLDRLLAFVQTLVGFYIAALAAVSSFNSPHLDHLMPKPAPEMCIKYNGHNQWVPATRRRFMTAMFAFLTAISFVFSLGSIGVLAFAGTVTVMFPAATLWLRPVAIFGVAFVVAQMTAVTFWGLYYLGERMLTPD